MARAQEWWQGADEDQRADQAYAANFAKAARWARDDDDYGSMGTATTTANKFGVDAGELHGYLNSDPATQAAIVSRMNDRIMPWRQGENGPDQSEYPQMPRLIDDLSPNPILTGQVPNAGSGLTDLLVGGESDYGLEYLLDGGSENNLDISKASQALALQPLTDGQDKFAASMQEGQKTQPELAEPSQMQAADTAAKGNAQVGRDKFQANPTGISSIDINVDTEEALDVDQADEHFDYDSVRLEYLYALRFLPIKSEIESIYDTATEQAKRLVEKHNILALTENDNPKDALRHVIASILLTRRYSSADAKLFMDLNEHAVVRTVRNMSLRALHNPPGHRLMDLFNNKLGREFALAPENESREALEIALEALLEGKLRLRPFKTKP